MRRFMMLLSLVAVSVLAATAFAGEGLTKIRDTVTLRRTLLGEQTVTVSKAAAKRDSADAEFAEAVALIDAGDEKSVKKAFKKIGKGMRRLEQAAKAEGSPTFSSFVQTTLDELWAACIEPFLPSPTVPDLTPEEVKLREKLGKKLRGPLKKAGKGKLSKAVKKLSKAYPFLLPINPDP